MCQRRRERRGTQNGCSRTPVTARGEKHVPEEAQAAQHSKWLLLHTRHSSRREACARGGASGAAVKISQNGCFRAPVTARGEQHVPEEAQAARHLHTCAHGPFLRVPTFPFYVYVHSVRERATYDAGALDFRAKHVLSSSK